MRTRLACVLVVVAALGGCVRGPAETVGTPSAVSPTPTLKPSTDTVLIHFGDATVDAEVVYKPEDTQRGLMHRQELAEDGGMLFLFAGGPRGGGFWMKNTLIPLSIAYLRKVEDGSFRVVDIQDMEPCDKGDDCPTYEAKALFDSALEVNQGWFDRNGVSEGGRAVVEGSLPTPS